MLFDLFAIFAAVYLASVTVYFITGAALARLNARHPERRIQPARRGEQRAGREIVASLGALAVSSALLAAGFFARREGWTPEPFAPSWWSVPVFFVVAMVLFDAWFYFGHRLLHWGPFYRFHALHHRSVAPSAWSNDSSTAVDTLIEHGFYLVVWFVLPAPAAAIFALRLYDQISGMIGHSGFEYFAAPGARAPSPFVCTTFHDLHHSQFNYNYSNMFSVWDRLLGTIHPGYDEMVRRIENGATPGEATMKPR